MTREEAIYKLEQTKRYSKYLSDDEIAAVVLAIKALEQEPCDDCISRQAVIEVIKSMTNDNPSYWNSCDVINRENILDEIEDLPSVTPQPKTGQWIINRDSIGRKYGECSECMMRQYVGTLNYCPNCGAKMEVQE